MFLLVLYFNEGLHVAGATLMFIRSLFCGIKSDIRFDTMAVKESGIGVWCVGSIHQSPTFLEKRSQGFDLRALAGYFGASNQKKKTHTKGSYIALSLLSLHTFLKGVLLNFGIGLGASGRYVSRNVRGDTTENLPFNSRAASWKAGSMKTPPDEKGKEVVRCLRVGVSELGERSDGSGVISRERP